MFFLRLYFELSVFNDFLFVKEYPIMLYFILYIAVGIWVFIDSKKRLFPQGKIYSVLTVIIGPLILPVYLAKRPLRKDETREGGTEWNILKNFALVWTLTIFVCGIVGYEPGASNSIALVMLFAIWIFPMVGAAILGFFLKKSSVVEHGPTGPLADHEEGSYNLKKFAEQAKFSAAEGIFSAVKGIDKVIDKVKREIDEKKNKKQESDNRMNTDQ